MQSTDRYSGLPPEKLSLWLDPIARDGYSNMAADELLSTRPEAWLRVYGWRKPAVSFGYFDTTAVASDIFPGNDVEYIRRWTGGGIVDHRRGWTYTLSLPACKDIIYPASDRLYLWIHAGLVEALRAHGVDCTLLCSDAPNGGRSCWASPVASDVVDAQGTKLAGAGQRRYRGAILHQGLIQECQPSDGWPQTLARSLCEQVEIVSCEEPYEGFNDELEALLQSKYLSESWSDESRGRRPSKASD